MSLREKQRAQGPSWLRINTLKITSDYQIFGLANAVAHKINNIYNKNVKKSWILKTEISMLEN